MFPDGIYKGSPDGAPIPRLHTARARGEPITPNEPKTVGDGVDAGRSAVSDQIEEDEAAERVQYRTDAPEEEHPLHHAAFHRQYFDDHR